MIQLYFLDTTVLAILIICSILVVTVQTVCVSLQVFQFEKKEFLKCIAEIILLAYIAILTTMPMNALLNRRYSIIDVSNYGVVIPIITIVLSILFTILAIQKKKLLSTIIVLCSLFISFYENNLFFATVYVITLMLLATRSIREIVWNKHKRKSTISPLSIKEGLEGIPCGVMFYDEDGYIYVINNTMYAAMFYLFNFEYKNGNSFWNDLNTKTFPNIEISTVQDEILFREKNSSKLFSKKSFFIGKKRFTELIVTDITELDKTVLALEANKVNLLLQEKEITILAEIEIQLKKEHEYARLRSQLHDIMGQRLTAIQRMLQTKEYESSETIIPLLQDIVKNIKNDYKESFNQSYFELKKYYENIGITINKKGDFPQNNEIAHIFLSAIREATTNAIRHAHANTIIIILQHTEKSWHMKITNNGDTPKNRIEEGIGLSSLRTRIESYGGKLSIESAPEFCITIDIQY